MSTLVIDIIILASGVCVLCPYFVVLSQRLWQLRRFKIGHAVQKLRALLSEACCVRCRKAPADAFEQCVRKLMDEALDRDALCTTKTSATITAPMVIAVLFHIVMKAPRWMSDERSFVLMFIATIPIVAKVWPASFRTDRLGTWYGIIMSASILWIATAERSENVFIFASVSSWYVRFLFSAGFQIRLPKVAFWQILYCTVSCSIFIREMPQEVAKVSARTFALFEIGIAVVLVVCTSWAVEGAWIVASQEVRATMLQGTSSASSTLLDLVCDVSFELDADLKFREDVPEFSAMVTLGNRINIKGMPLTSFMVGEDDKQLVEQPLHVELPGDGSGSLAGLQKLKLRDSLGNHVETEVFYVRYEHLGTRIFKVGVRECGEHSIAELKAFPQRPRGSSISSRRRRLEAKVAYLQAATGAADDTEPGGSEGERDADSMSDCGSTLSASSAFSDSGHLAPVTLGVRSDQLSGVRPSQRKAMAMSLKHTMQRWRLHQDGRSFCCPWHRCLKEQELLNFAMRRGSCQPNFDALGDQQCAKCGILYSCVDLFQDWTCDICRFKNPVQRASDQLVATCTPGHPHVVNL
mmetsp:Transcript_78197/g.252840  ORF Transcript_78197/g.252840 Transcript_78197/m.252840 type:complete len:580 (+) Transcript_78197:72-1811(+)